MHIHTHEHTHTHTHYTHKHTLTHTHTHTRTHTHAHTHSVEGAIKEISTKEKELIKCWNCEKIGIGAYCAECGEPLDESACVCVCVCVCMNVCDGEEREGRKGHVFFCMYMRAYIHVCVCLCVYVCVCVYVYECV